MSSRMNIPLPLIILVALTLALVPLFVAQNSPQDCFTAHNKAHSQVAVGPIAWDETVASYASNYANTLASHCLPLVHLAGPYGENLAWGSIDLTGIESVNLWVAEEPDYNYSSNSCAPEEVCGHYTQVVWHNLVWLGRAKVRCTMGGSLVTCNYYPPGNAVGQKPY